MIAATIFATLTALNQQPPQLQSWARSTWSNQDKAYSQILAEVRPYFGKDGFIDEKLVSQKYSYHVGNFLRNKNDSLLLMRALAWHEIALSDGNIFRFSNIKPIQREFVSAIRLWNEPINSFSFVRTMAICYLFSTSPDMFVENRLIEKLYAKAQNDTELELTYLVWVSMNDKVAPNRFTIQRLLEKQELLAFRRGARLLPLSTCYHFAKYKEPPSKKFLEKGIELRTKYIDSLPPGHLNNTAKYKADAIENAKQLRKMAQKWRDGG